MRQPSLTEYSGSSGGLQVTEVKWMALHPFALLSVPTGLALLDAHGCVRRSGS